jgi:hypothetical protein
MRNKTKRQKKKRYYDDEVSRGACWAGIETTLTLASEHARCRCLVSNVSIYDLFLWDDIWTS